MNAFIQKAIKVYQYLELKLITRYLKGYLMFSSNLGLTVFPVVCFNLTQ